MCIIRLATKLRSFSSLLPVLTRWQHRPVTATTSSVFRVGNYIDSTYRQYCSTTMSLIEKYEVTASVKVHDKIPVTKYRSKVTGMTLCIAEVEGPLVNGYFCLATEAHDDDGLPHTLEHLIFLGSEDYPYKGVLDLLANRCLASGTNAWTDTDHTCYTMTNAGCEGFLQLMPVYLDHILYPTITDSGFVTEVHHINGEGEDAGVVYCEMQARESSGESITYLNMLREMYPGHCGYKSETGGIMENLRTSTTYEKIRDYHREFYRPENLCLVITGQVKPEQVFAALQPFEEKVSKKPKLPPYVRPWQSPVPSLPKSVVRRIPFPSDDEDLGMVFVSWRGPQACDQYTMSACMVLMEYLTDTSVAPLQRDFVEIENPFCTKVRYSLIENSESTIYVFFENVPKERLGTVNDRLVQLLKGIAEKKETFNMDRMKSVIHRRVLESLDHFETQPHDTFAFICIGDFLYGDTANDFKERFNHIKVFKDLAKKDEGFWINLIKTYMLDKASVTIEGDPSIKCMEDMSKSEKDRIAAQKVKLGEKGLLEKAAIVENANEENEIPAPEEMLTKVKIPDVGCIHFHPISTSNNHESKANVIDKFPLDGLPVMIQLDDIHTNFVELTALLNTECIPENLKLYLPLLMEIILESPLLRNGVFVPHDEVITQLAADTLSCDTSLGVTGGRFSCGDYAQVAKLCLKVEQEKYETGVKWLQELLFKTEFTNDRIKIIGNKMANDVARFKRDGPKVVTAIGSDINFKKGSNIWTSIMMRQNKFLTQTLKRMENESSQVINDLKTLRSNLCHPDNLRIHIAMDVAVQSKLGNLQTCWKSFLPEGLPVASKISTPQPSHKFLYELKEAPYSGMIAGVGSVESNFLVQTSPCMTTFTHEDLPALMVLIQYLTQLEGPMWKQIRGLGLSYHYSIRIKPESGLIYFILYKSSHLVNAYRKGKEIIEDYLSGKTPFSNVEYESAKSSLIFQVIERETTVSDASHQSLLSYFRGTSKDYNRDLLKKVADVTVNDMINVGPKYFKPLFDTNQSRTAICCHPSKVEEIKSGMKEFGRDLTVLESLEDGFLAKL